MNKFFRLTLRFCFICAVLIFVFPACDLQFPTAVLVKGNPEVRFAATIPLGDMFKEALDGMKESLEGSGSGGLGMNIIKCTGTEYETFLIYSKILDEKFDLTDIEIGEFPEEIPEEFLEYLRDVLGVDINNPAVEITVDGKKELLEETEIILPFDDAGELLDGFSFEGAKIILYISGSGGLADLLTLDLTIGNGTKQNFPISGSMPSGINSWVAPNYYTGTTAPTAGAVAVINLNSLAFEELTIKYSVYIADGKTIIPSHLNEEATIKVEAVIWLPLELTAGSGAPEIVLMDSIMEDDIDLFGRTADGDGFDLSDFVSSFSFGLQLNNNPFQGAELKAVSPGKNGSPGVTIPVVLSGNSILLNINEQLLRDINDPDNIPFNPSISLEFKPNGKLAIPREFDLAITSLELSAALNFRMEL